MKYIEHITRGNEGKVKKNKLKQIYFKNTLLKFMKRVFMIYLKDENPYFNQSNRLNRLYI